MQNTSRSLPSPTGSVAVRTPSQTEIQLADTDRALEGLDKALTVLNEKIQPVLRPAHPANPTGELPEEGLVPVADKIRRIAKRVTSLTQFVESLTERAEA